MAEKKKMSKTARASLGNKSEAYAQACPQCGTAMVATKVIKYAGRKPDQDLIPPCGPGITPTGVSSRRKPVFPARPLNHFSRLT